MSGIHIKTPTVLQACIYMWLRLFSFFFDPLSKQHEEHQQPREYILRGLHEPGSFGVIIFQFGPHTLSLIYDDTEGMIMCTRNKACNCSAWNLAKAGFRLRHKRRGKSSTEGWTREKIPNRRGDASPFVEKVWVVASWTRGFPFNAEMHAMLWKTMPNLWHRTFISI